MYIKTDTQRVQRILTATVMAAAIMSALSACGGGGGGGSKSAGLPGTNIPTNPAAACRATPAPPAIPETRQPRSWRPHHADHHAGALQTSLGNTGKAVDNVLPLNLGTTLGGIGKALDPTVKPVTDQVVSLTQKVGATTGLGQPVNGVLQQTGGLVSNLGTTVKGTGLPGGLGVGVGGLVDGLGKTVASAGGLLNASPNNPDPLKTVLGNATNAVGALTAGLGGQGGLLNPVNKLVGGVTGGVLSGPYKPVLEPALANTGKAADNLLPLGLGPTLGGVGAALDPTVGPLAGTVTNLTQQVGATTKLGAPVAGLLNNVGGTVAGLGGQVGNTAGLGGVLQGWAPPSAAWAACSTPRRATPTRWATRWPMPPAPWRP